MDRRADEIDFHFHLDSQLIDEFRSFHFHLHVEDSKEHDSRRPLEFVRQESPLSHHDDPQSEYGLVDICTPQQSYPTDVKSDSSGNHICAIVKAVRSGEDAREVRARIYQGECPDDHYLPEAPVSSETIQGHLVQIGYLPSPYDTCNFVFLEETSNLIPGAAANASGTAENCLVVWARFDGTGSWNRTKTNFLGRTSASVACDPLSSAGPLQFVMAEMPSIEGQLLPQQYRVWLDTEVQEAALKGTPLEGAAELLRRLAHAGPIVLSRDQARSTPAVPQWSRSCPRDGRWNLRVTHTPQGANAVLTCGAIGDSVLSSAVIWQAMPWQEFGANRLTVTRPSTLTASGLTCIVDPA